MGDGSDGSDREKMVDGSDGERMGRRRRRRRCEGPTVRDERADHSQSQHYLRWRDRRGADCSTHLPLFLSGRTVRNLTLNNDLSFGWGSEFCFSSLTSVVCPFAYLL